MGFDATQSSSAGFGLHAHGAIDSLARFVELQGST
jgi:hypothetical protein